MGDATSSSYGKWPADKRISDFEEVSRNLRAEGQTSRADAVEALLARLRAAEAEVERLSKENDEYDQQVEGFMAVIQDVSEQEEKQRRHREYALKEARDGMFLRRMDCDLYEAQLVSLRALLPTPPAAEPTAGETVMEWGADDDGAFWECRVCCHEFTVRPGMGVVFQFCPQCGRRISAWHRAGERSEG